MMPESVRKKPRDRHKKSGTHDARKLLTINNYVAIAPNGVVQHGQDETIKNI